MFQVPYSVFQSAVIVQYNGRDSGEIMIGLTHMPDFTPRYDYDLSVIHINDAFWFLLKDLAHKDKKYRGNSDWGVNLFQKHWGAISLSEKLTGGVFIQRCNVSFSVSHINMLGTLSLAGRVN